MSQVMSLLKDITKHFGFNQKCEFQYTHIISNQKDTFSILKYKGIESKFTNPCQQR